jgi:hypothetical protein
MPVHKHPDFLLTTMAAVALWYVLWAVIGTNL